MKRTQRNLECQWLVYAYTHEQPHRYLIATFDVELDAHIYARSKRLQHPTWSIVIAHA